jgi:vacuolar-type H+-ATPase subunit E/Vma4
MDDKRRVGLDTDTARLYSAASNQNNKSRLRLLSLREELLEEAFEESREGLSKLTKDKGRYSGVLQKLILQVSQPPFDTQLSQH